MKGTRLWTAAGSPLIQGRSRRERPFSSDWLTGWVVGGLIGAALVVGVMVYNGTELMVAVSSVWIPAIPSAALGSALGVWLGGNFGWHPRWVAGAVAAGLAAVAAVATFLWVLGPRIGG